LRAAVLALLALQLGVGVAWTALNLRDVPHYGDTNEYLELARTLRVDLHRGFGYPVFLAAMDRLKGGATILSKIPARHPEGRCSAPFGIVAVQLTQLLLCAVALAYFLRVVLVLQLPRRGWPLAAFAFLLAMLLLDPLVAHFSLSVMPDALALSASLAFCAALANLGLGRSSPRVAGGVLLGAFVVAAGVRPEKSWVLLGTTLATLIAWFLWPRLASASPPLVTAGRVSRILVLVAAGLAITLGTQQALHQDYGRRSHRAAILHGRIVFPHLSAIYDELPARSRALLSRKDARRYDADIIKPGWVIRRATRGNPALDDQLTHDLVVTAWRVRWGRILLDTAKDALENVLPTPSFYFRLAAFDLFGDEFYRRWSPSDMVPFTYTRLSQHHLVISRVHLALSGAAFLLVSGIALAELVRARRRPRGGDAGERVQRWTPVAAFVVVNAVLFAVHGDLVHPRYTLAGHVVALAVLYSVTLRWAAARQVEP